MNAAIDPARLYVILQKTGLQRKDANLYQLLYNLIGNVVNLTANQTGSSSGGGGGSSTTTIENIIQLIDLGGGGSGDDGSPGPPGLQGAAGSNGATGAQGPMGSPGMDGADGSQGETIFVPTPPNNVVNATSSVNTTTQTYTSTVQAALTFNSNQYDAQGMWSIGNPTRFTAQTAGKYLVRGQLGITATAGIVFGRIYKNGADTNLGDTSATVDSSSNEIYSVSGIVDLVVGDYIEFMFTINLYQAASVDTVANLSIGQIVQQSPQTNAGLTGPPGPTGATGASGIPGMPGIDGSDGELVFIPSAPPLSGSLILLEEHTVSSAASITFTTRNVPRQSGATFQSDYDEYVIELINVAPTSNNVSVTGRFSSDNGTSYDSSGVYGNLYQFSIETNTSGSGGSGADTNFGWGNVSNANATGISGSFRLFNPLSSSLNKTLVGQVTFYHTTPGFIRFTQSFLYKSTSVINAFQFTASSGNLNGTIRVYGLKS